MFKGVIWAGDRNRFETYLSKNSFSTAEQEPGYLSHQVCSKF